MSTLCALFSSSFAPLATGVSVDTLPPVYALSSVSNPLPEVDSANVPDVGGVTFHQIDDPPDEPAWFGSEGSFVAPNDGPLTLAGVPEVVAITVAAPKASFGGDASAEAENATWSVTAPAEITPCALRDPSTAMR